jgi:hypothetical protein
MHARTHAHAACRSQLDALGSDVAASLERVDGRERQLNSQCEGLLAGYRDARRQLGALQEEHSRRVCGRGGVGLCWHAAAALRLVRGDGAQRP